MAKDANGSDQAQRLKEILSNIKALAVEYYQLTGKPLGVTGDVAEYVVAQTLGLDFVGDCHTGALSCNRYERSHEAGTVECEKTDGTLVEVVAKFAGGRDRGDTALAMEVVAACLAADLGLPVPKPYLLGDRSSVGWNNS